MSNVLFDKNTLKWSGTDREKLPFEVEIRSVELEGLYKIIEVPSMRVKVNEDGEELFQLPQAPIKRVEKVVERVETTDVTQNPVTEFVMQQVPLLDENEKPVTYQRTQTIKVTEDTGRPVIIEVFIEDSGRFEKTQELDEEGNELFYKDVKVGPIEPCYTMENVEVQKKNIDGKLLYIRETSKDVEFYDQVEPLEITKTDKRYREGLAPVLEPFTDTQDAYFESAPELFVYEDLVQHKQKQMTSGTFMSHATLYEQLGDDVFSNELASFDANLGFDFISIPPKGQARTKKLQLAIPASIIAIKLESSYPGIIVSAGSTVDSIKPLDRNGELVLSKEETGVYVLLENPTDVTIDVESFAILV